MFLLLPFLLIAAAIVLLALAALLFKIDFLIKGQDKEAQVSIRILGITLLHRKFAIRREKVEIFTLYRVDKPQPKRVISLLDIIKKSQEKRKKRKSDKTKNGKLFAYINKKVSYQLSLKLEIGLDDAFATAMVCGVVQAAAGAIIALVEEKKHYISISVRPAFSKSSFSLSTDCIITFCLANIIIAYAMYKMNKGR